MATKVKFTMLLMLLITGLAKGQPYVGLKAGVNFSNVMWTETVTKYPVKFNSGFQVGFTFTSPIKSGLFIQPGILFSSKGFKKNYEDEIGKGFFVAHPFYLELPVNVLYFIPNKSDRNVFIGAGPYAAYGLGGYWEVKYKPGNKVGNLKFNGNLTQPRQNLLSNEDTYNYVKHFDYGLNILIGYELSGILQVQLSAQKGLKNLAPTYNGKPTHDDFKNISSSLSLGYIL